MITEPSLKDLELRFEKLKDEFEKVEGFMYPKISNSINENRKEVIRTYEEDDGDNTYEIEVTKVYSLGEASYAICPKISRYLRHDLWTEVTAEHLVCKEMKGSLRDTKTDEQICELCFPKYRANLLPLFAKLEGVEYLFHYPRDGCYEILDMSGERVASIEDVYNMPSSVVQIDGGDLVLNSWVWHPVQFQRRIKLRESIEKGTIQWEIVRDAYELDDLEEEILSRRKNASGCV